jgi:fatty acid desaturase
MYCFDITGFSSYEWRVSHCYSHHTYPNTINDFEQNALKKIINYYPINNKYNAINYYLLPIISNIGFTLAIPLQIIRRYVALLKRNIEFRMEYILNLIILIVSIYIRYKLTSSGLFNKQLIYNSIRYVLSSFLIIMLTCSWVFSTVGLAAGHHHPHIWHAGDDTVNSTINNNNNNNNNKIDNDNNIDWGLFQLSAVGERPSLDSNLFLSSSLFGRHALHHLFPTIDHSKLNLLLPILKSTCKDFNVKYFSQISNNSQIPTENSRYLSNFASWLGMWLQAYRNQPSHRNYITFNSTMTNSN